jgi:hypothetical protein
VVSAAPMMMMCGGEMAQKARLGARKTLHFNTSKVYVHS